MSNKYHEFKIGLNTFVLKNNRLLLGKRKNIYGAGSWGLPGGHLEEREEMKKGALRELFEETGLKSNKIEFLNLVNDIREDQHYVQVAFLAEKIIGKLQIKEPDKCEEWKWFEIDDLPKNIFVGHRKNIKGFLREINFYDGY